LHTKDFLAQELRKAGLEAMAVSAERGHYDTPPLVQRHAPKLPNALLPAISQVAHEIEITLTEVGQALAHLKGRL
jgi:hypothetical protein